MGKKKKQQSKIDSVLKPSNGMAVQQAGRNNIRKNNMNYTNINKNRGK